MGHGNMPCKNPFICDLNLANTFSNLFQKLFIYFTQVERDSNPRLQIMSLLFFLLNYPPPNKNNCVKKEKNPNPVSWAYGHNPIFTRRGDCCKVAEPNSHFNTLSFKSNVAHQNKQYIESHTQSTNKIL